MKIGGLSILKRTSSPKTRTLLSWHSPHSLTWRWVLSFTRFAPGEFRVWPIGTAYRDNNGLQWWVRVPFLGFIQWSQQRPMWYRRLYWDLTNERETTRSPRPQDMPPLHPHYPPEAGTLH